MCKNLCSVSLFNKNTLSYCLTKKVIKKLEFNNVSFFFKKDVDATGIYFLPKRFLKKDFLFFKNSLEYSEWYLSGTLFFSLKNFTVPYSIYTRNCFRFNNGVFFFSTFLKNINKRSPERLLGVIQSIQIVTLLSAYRFIIYNTLKIF